MMKKLLLILLCLPMIGFGQGWEKYISLVDSNSYFSNYGEQTLDGGYIITGGFYNSQTSLFLLKLDSQGDTLWNKTYPNINGEMRGWSVHQTSDSGYIISAIEGFIDSSVSLIIKTNPYGDTLWTKYFDWTIGFLDIEQTSDEGYIIRATAWGPAPWIWNDGVLIKTDVQGDTLWTKNYQGITGQHSVDLVKQTTDGGYILTSTPFDFQQNLFAMDTAFLNKTDSQGNLLWNTNIYNTSDTNVYPTSVEQTSDGGYIVSGSLVTLDTITQTCNGTYSASFLIKFDSLSNKQWTKIYNQSNISSINGQNLFGGSAEQTNDGGYITLNFHLGDTLSFENCSTNIVLIKTDVVGDTLWTKKIEVGDSLSSVGCIQQTIDGGYFIVTTIEGSFFKESGRGIIYLIKTDGNGNVTSTFHVPTINTSKGKLINIVDILGREVNEKRNTPLFYIYDDGTVEKRIVIEQ